MGVGIPIIMEKGGDPEGSLKHTEGKKGANKVSGKLGKRS